MTNAERNRAARSLSCSLHCGADVVLKLLKMAKSVRALLDTVVQALPEVGNLGLLFFLLFFIFAALGVELFGRVGEHCYLSMHVHLKHSTRRRVQAKFNNFHEIKLAQNQLKITKSPTSSI